MGLKDLIKKNEVSSNLSDIKITIAGRPKTGKTSLFYHILQREGGLDSGLLLAFERGYNFLPGINVIDIDSWETFVEVVDDLSEGNHGFKYIAIDTVDIAGRLCEKYVLAKASRKDGKRYESLPDLPYGKAYDLLETEFSLQISRLEQSNLGLFFITHDKDRTVEEKSGLKYEKTSMSISGRAGEFIKNTSDFIVFIDVENKKEKVNGKKVSTENRIMRFRGDGTTEAGGRITDIEETIDYDVDKFLEVIKQAIEKQSQRLASGTHTPVKNKVEYKKVEDEDVEEATGLSEDEYIDEEATLALEQELETVKYEIAEKIKSMSADERRDVKSLFKQELGIINYTKSDDLQALQNVLKSM